jgi:hypothetical protein
LMKVEIPIRPTGQISWCGFFTSVWRSRHKEREEKQRTLIGVIE